MSTIFTIAKRELAAYFRSPIAYIFLVTYLVLTFFLFFKSFFLIGQADLRNFFVLMPWIFLFYCPAITMGLWAEERKSGTLELLLTLPVATHTVVIGKLLAALGLLVSALICTVPLPIVIAKIGPLDWGLVAGGYAGLIGLGSAYLAVGLAVSSCTKNHIIAFIMTVMICFLLLIIGEPIVTVALPSRVVPVLQYLGLGYHFDSIGRGVFDSRDLIYYISLIGTCVWINFEILARRR